MVGDDDDELSKEDLAAIEASREYFRQGGQGVVFEAVVEDIAVEVRDIPCA